MTNPILSDSAQILFDLFCQENLHITVEPSEILFSLNSYSARVDNGTLSIELAIDLIKDAVLSQGLGDVVE